MFTRTHTNTYAREARRVRTEHYKQVGADWRVNSFKSMQAPKQELQYWDPPYV